MKKILAVLLLVFVVFVVMEKHRLYVRDPLGSLTRAGAKEAGAQVYINFDNDVLIENDNAPVYFELLQHGGRMGAPTSPMHCVHWMACLIDADQPTLDAVGDKAKIVSMSSKEVRFVDGKGQDAVVTLR